MGRNPAQIRAQLEAIGRSLGMQKMTRTPMVSVSFTLKVALWEGEHDVKPSSHLA
jgi:hypothetical protein